MTKFHMCIADAYASKSMSTRILKARTFGVTNCNGVPQIWIQNEIKMSIKSYYMVVVLSLLYTSRLVVVNKLYIY